MLSQLLVIASCKGETQEPATPYTAADSAEVLHDGNALQTVCDFLSSFGTVRNEAKPFTRAYPAENVEEAEDLFRCIAGTNDDLISETADGLRLSLDGLRLSLDGGRTDMGHVDFHREGEGCVAYADVSVPTVGNVHRIEYLDSASWGENAVTGGYKKGDILRYIGNDSRITKGSLWICTRQVNGGLEGCLSLLEYRPGSSVSLEDKKDDPNYAPCPVTQFSGEVTKKYTAADPHRIVALRELLNLLATMDKKKKDKIIKQFPDALPMSDYDQSPCFRAPAGVIYQGSRDHQCAIIYDASYISKFWVYDDRRINFVELPQSTTKVSQAKDNTFTYVEKSTWTDKFWNSYWHSLFIYNAKYFTERLDDEFTVVLSP